MLISNNSNISFLQIKQKQSTILAYSLKLWIVLHKINILLNFSLTLSDHLALPIVSSIH